MPSGEEARNSMTFSVKAQQHSVAGQLFLSFRGKKIITVGRHSIYNLMHCFVRNPCMMHHCKNKRAQIPHHCLHGILSLTSWCLFPRKRDQKPHTVISSRRKWILLKDKQRHHLNFNPKGIFVKLTLLVLKLSLASAHLLSNRSDRHFSIPS